MHQRLWLLTFPMWRHRLCRAVAAVRRAARDSGRATASALLCRCGLWWSPAQKSLPGAPGACVGRLLLGVLPQPCDHGVGLLDEWLQPWHGHAFQVCAVGDPFREWCVGWGRVDQCRAVLVGCDGGLSGLLTGRVQRRPRSSPLASSPRAKTPLWPSYRLGLSLQPASLLAALGVTRSASAAFLRW